MGMAVDEGGNEVAKTMMKDLLKKMLKNGRTKGR